MRVENRMMRWKISAQVNLSLEQKPAAVLCHAQTAWDGTHRTTPLKGARWIATEADRTSEEAADGLTPGLYLPVDCLSQCAHVYGGFIRTWQWPGEEPDAEVHFSGKTIALVPAPEEAARAARAEESWRLESLRRDQEARRKERQLRHAELLRVVREVYGEDRRTWPTGGVHDTIVALESAGV